MATAMQHTRGPRGLRDAALAFEGEANDRAIELESRVAQLAAAKRDAVVDTRAFLAHAAPPNGIALTEGGAADIDHIVLHAQGQQLTVAINDLAHDQLAQRTGIPKDYYRRMLATQPALLADNINTWFAREPDKRLFRMLAPIGDADHARMARLGATLALRGILGATYRMIDNAELLAATIPIARQRGALLKEFSLDDRRLHARFITAEQSIQSIRDRVAALHGVAAAEVATHQRANGQDLSWVNEVIRAGFSLRNSEVGFASLEVASFINILKCLNGLIVPAEARVRHAGSRNQVEAGDMRWLSAATQQLDNAALMSRAQDAVNAALEDRQIAQLGNTILLAKVEEVAMEAPLFDWLDNIGRRLDMTDGQIDLYKEETVAAIREEKCSREAPSRFAIAQGLTAVARQIEDMDRRTELERTGWAWIEGTSADLVKLGAEAVKRRSAKN